jgi:hypothetical protein
LPNDGVLPTASTFTESFEEIFSAEWFFITKLGPQVSPFPVPIFGVNKGPTPNLAPYNGNSITFLYVLVHPLGSTRKQTYSDQPIFLFPEQNGHRFD